MPRVYVPKTTRQKVSDEKLQSILVQIDSNKLSVNDLARKNKISPKTLRYHLKKFREQKSAGVNYQPYENSKPNQVFTADQEKVLSDYFITSANIKHGYTRQEAKSFVYQFALHNDIIMPNSWEEKKEAGRDWFDAFLRRNPQLSVRIAENVSLNRLNSFTPLTLKVFHDNLESVLIENPELGADDIFVMDETRVTTVPKQHAVIAERGSKNVAQATSDERGASMTFAPWINAAGESINPTFIIPRKNFKEKMLDGAPKGSIAYCNNSGYNLNGDFILQLKVFQKTTNASKQNKKLLIVDNHASHISYEAALFADENGIIILTLPPHSTHVLMPLDVGCFGPFQNYYRSELHKALNMNDSSRLTIYDIPRLVNKAYEKAFTPKTIQNSFRKTGK